MNIRDNFPRKVIDVVKTQAAYICSRPQCRRLTIAPSNKDEMSVQYIGKVAHIHAASPNGPRYLNSMTPSERKSISNGLFLCSACADLIDKNNGIDYDVDTLKAWKEEHRLWVSQNLNKSLSIENIGATITSNNQLGGITAHTVSINNLPQQNEANDRKEADKVLFLTSEEIMNNTSIIK